MTIDKM